MIEKKSPAGAQVYESKVRLVAFFVFVLILVYGFSNTFIIPVFLVIDFTLRSFQWGKFSLLGFLSDQIIIIFKLPLKVVYYPPKRFAARIGLLFSFLILLFHMCNWNTGVLTSTLAFFAFLESFFGFCAGCYVYSFLVRK
jgi:hypothetical protein